MTTLEAGDPTDAVDTPVINDAVEDLDVQADDIEGRDLEIRVAEGEDQEMTAGTADEGDLDMQVGDDGADVSATDLDVKMDEADQMDDDGKPYEEEKPGEDEKDKDLEAEAKESKDVLEVDKEIELKKTLARLSTSDTALKCIKCNQKYTFSQIKLFKDWSKQPLLGDEYYEYSCQQCGKESIKRLGLSWIDVVSLALYNLNLRQGQEFVLDGKCYFHWKSQICDFIENHWELFWIREKSSTWRNSVASCLSTSPKFVSLGVEKRNGEQGLWALDDLENVFYDTKKRAPQYNISKDGSLYEPLPTTKRKRTPQKKRLSLDYNFTDFINIYPDLENPPVGTKVKISTQSTHSAPQMEIKDNIVRNRKGYRMAKATHGVWVDQWYFEAKIMNDVGSARIGYSQISGDLQAPCGYDQFSYSIRSLGGIFHESTLTKPIPGPKAGSSEVAYKKGDVLGILIDLGSECKDDKYEGLEIDTKLLTRLWDELRMEDYIPFRHSPFNKLKGTKITFYVNGKEYGAHFDDLYQGKYYPSISLYGGCEVSVNFGPDFEYFDHLKPQGVHPFSHSSTLKQWNDIVDEYINGKPTEDPEPIESKKKIKEGPMEEEEDVEIDVDDVSENEEEIEVDDVEKVEDGTEDIDIDVHS